MTVPVLLPLALQTPYHYAVPAGMTLAAGDFVRVPVMGRDYAGIVWPEGPEGHDSPPAKLRPKLRPVREKYDLPPLPPEHCQFLARAARWTMAPAGAFARLTLTGGSLMSPLPRSTASQFWRAASSPPAFRLTAQRKSILAKAQTPIRLADLAVQADVGPASVKRLAALGVLELAPEPQPVLPDPQKLVLTGEQQACQQAIIRALAEGKFSASLLTGQTGSGKTEAGFASLAAAAQHGQALLLLPEIALTDYVVRRFSKTFAARPAVWHSGLSRRARQILWRKIALGEEKIIIGARSALFLPYRRLRFIAVDEEHDSSFKQEDGVLYHARDMALLRAQCGGFPVLLSSATPSLESLANVRRHHWRRFHLSGRIHRARPPVFQLVDMRGQKTSAGYISPPLRRASQQTLAAGGQVLFFLNRRGFAPLAICRSCGWRYECPNCSSWLVEHRRVQRLMCHHCAHTLTPGAACPNCREAAARIACGPGIERIAEETASLFPRARIALLSRDHPAEAAGRARLFEEMADGQIHILIGTQSLAKGLHFPGLALAGIIDADLGLSLSDLRAGERSAQLLQQVAGRTGRGRLEGRALIQTRQPDHPLMRALASGKMEDFLAEEAKLRRQRHLPPYGRLAALILSAASEDEVRAAAAGLATLAPPVAQPQAHSWLGPAPAPLFRLRRRYRMRFLVRARRSVALQNWLQIWLKAWEKTPYARRVRLAVDIDPYHFL